MIESAAMPAHQFIQFPLARVTKRRMPDVMYQRQCLRKFRIQPQRSGHGPRDLPDFQRMCQTVAKVIGKPRREYLGLGFEPPKCSRMNDAVTIPRILASIRMGCFGMAPSTRMLFEHRPRRSVRNSIDGIDSARKWKTSRTTGCRAQRIT